MPEASDAELIEATESWRAYLKVVYEIYRRLKWEGRFPLGGLGDVGTKK